MPRRTVIRVTQSPMNAKQWCCDLDCGHEQWVTASRRPKNKTLECHRCIKAATPR